MEFLKQLLISFLLLLYPIMVELQQSTEATATNYDEAKFYPTDVPRCPEYQSAVRNKVLYLFQKMPAVQIITCGQFITNISCWQFGACSFVLVLRKRNSSEPVPALLCLSMQGDCYIFNYYNIFFRNGLKLVLIYCMTTLCSETQPKH